MNPHNTLHAPHVNDRRDFPAGEHDNTEGPESRPERTSEQPLKSAAEDFSATVEAEGEAALREAILDDLEIEDWEEENPPGLRVEKDDAGAVSPDELGERFVRGATQQERHSEGHDTAPNGGVDALSDSVQQGSLFDRNPTPLEEKRVHREPVDEKRLRQVTAPPRRDEGHAAPDRAVPRPPPSPRRRVASR